MIRIVIPGKPVPKARARLARNGRVYTPRQTVEYERTGKIHAWLAMAGAPPLECPVMCRILVRCEIPKRWPKARKIASHKMPCPSRPDLDNYVKSALDIMNGIVIKDDAQVCHITAWKMYSNDDPNMEIIVWEAATEIDKPDIGRPFGKASRPMGTGDIKMEDTDD